MSHPWRDFVKSTSIRSMEKRCSNLSSSVSCVVVFRPLLTLLSLLPCHFLGSFKSQSTVKLMCAGRGALRRRVWLLNGAEVSFFVLHTKGQGRAVNGLPVKNAVVCLPGTISALPDLLCVSTFFLFCDAMDQSQFCARKNNAKNVFSNWVGV